MNSTELKLIESTAEVAEDCGAAVVLLLEMFLELPMPVASRMQGQKAIAEMQAKTASLGEALTKFKAYRQIVDRMTGGARR